MHSRFTYCPLDMSLPESLRVELVQELLAVDEEFWHFNQYRNCHILPLRNGGGGMGNNTMRHGEEFIWTPVMQELPTQKRYLTETIMPLLPSDARFFVLRTDAGASIFPHIDTAPNEIGSMQEKLRVALSGRLENLIFFDRNLERHRVPSNRRVYVLDGGHAHAVEAAEEQKLTICVGSPWRGPLSDYGESLLLHEEAMHTSRPAELPLDWHDARFLEKN